MKNTKHNGDFLDVMKRMDTGRDYIVIESDKNLYSEMKTRVESYENI